MNDNTPAASGAAPLTVPSERIALQNILRHLQTTSYYKGKMVLFEMVYQALEDSCDVPTALASPQVAPAPEHDHNCSTIYHARAKCDCSLATPAQVAPLGFEPWLRTVCITAPPPQAYDLAKQAWAQGMERGAALASREASPAPVAPPNLSSPLAGDCRTVGGFLSDVMTAAGLVEHGRQCKPLAERMSVACSDFRARIFQGFASVAPQDDARDAARWRALPLGANACAPC